MVVLVFRAAALFYIPTGSEQEFQSLHGLDHTDFPVVGVVVVYSGQPSACVRRSLLVVLVLTATLVAVANAITFCFLVPKVSEVGVFYFEDT